MQIQIDDEVIMSLLQQVLESLFRRRAAAHLDVQVGPAVDVFTHKSRRVRVWRYLMSVELKATEQVPLTVTPKDRKGNAAKIDGQPAWQIDNADVADLSLSDDGTTCTVKAKKVGTARVSVEVDADLGPDVQTLGGFIDVSVVPGAAVNVEINTGTPEPQPE